MTWFETEQMCEYIAEISQSLEEWTLDRVEMRDVLTELHHLQQRLKREIHRHIDSAQSAVLEQLLSQLAQCRLCINERLKY